MDKEKYPKKNKSKSSKVKPSSKVRPSSKVTRLDSVRKKAKEKNKKHKDKNNFYYSFLTIVLLICLVQISFSAILNISKTISYHSKIVQIRKIRNEAEAKNKKLKNDIRNFSSTENLEAIARNNLKMAGEDEVLILINDKDKEEQEATKKKKKGLFKNGR